MCQSQKLSHIVTTRDDVVRIFPFNWTVPDNFSWHNHQIVNKKTVEYWSQISCCVCLCLCVWGSEVTNPTSPTIINWPWPSRKFANTQVAASGSWWCWWSDQHQSQSCHWYIYIFLSPLLSHCNFSEAACATCVITGAERCYHGKISLRTINTQRTFNLLMILHYKISWDFWVMKGLKLI